MTALGRITRELKTEQLRDLLNLTYKEQRIPRPVKLRQRDFLSSLVIHKLQAELYIFFFLYNIRLKTGVKYTLLM